ncbi:hypothetical protein HMPREF0578_2057, partial [Mobiluncus mulieris 28-1]
IVKIFDQNYRVYGIRKIWRAMRRAGFAIGREQAGRLMRLAGIHGAHRGRKPVTTRPSPPGYTPGLGSTPVQLQRAEPAVGRGYHLCQNFVGFRVHSFCYRRVFTQDCGLGYQVNYAPEALPLEALEQAIGCAKDNLAGLIHHADHGCQYVSIKYSQRLTDAGIRSSTGTIGDSYDNALAETVNGLYKTELIYSQTWLMHRSRMGDPELGVLVESPASPRIARLFHSRGSNNPI